MTYEISKDRHGRPRAEKVLLTGRATPGDRRRGMAPRLLCATAFLGLLGLFVSTGRLPAAVLWLYLATSGLSIIAYAVDKAAAKRDARRIQENTMHLFAIAGGWPGALVAQRLFRHKTRKGSFQLVFWLCVAANVVGLCWLLTPEGARLFNVLLSV